MLPSVEEEAYSRRRQSVPMAVSKTPTVQRRASVPDATVSHSVPATPRTLRRSVGEGSDGSFASCNLGSASTSQRTEAKSAPSSYKKTSGAFESYREQCSEWAQVLTESGVEFTQAAGNPSPRSHQALAQASRSSRASSRDDTDSFSFSTRRPSSDTDADELISKSEARSQTEWPRESNINASIHARVLTYQQRVAELLATHARAQASGDGHAWQQIIASVNDGFEGVERAMRQVAMEMHDANVDETREKFRQQEKMHEKKMEAVRKAAESQVAQERIVTLASKSRSNRRSRESCEAAAPLQATASDSQLPETEEEEDDSFEEECEILRERLRTAEAKLDKLESERDQLEVQLATASREAKRASEQQAEECKRLTQALSDRLEGERAKPREQRALESMVSQLDALGCQVASLHQENRRLQTDFASMSSEVRAAEEDKEALSSEREKSKAVIQEAMCTFGAQLSDGWTFKESVTALVAKMAAMAEEMETAKAAAAITIRMTPEAPVTEATSALENADRTVTSLMHRLQMSEAMRMRTESESERMRESLVRATLVALQSLRAHLTRTLSGLPVQQAQQRLAQQGTQRSGPLAMPEVTVRSPPLLRPPSRPESAPWARRPSPRQADQVHSARPSPRQAEQVHCFRLHGADVGWGSVRLLSSSPSPALQKRWQSS